MSDTQELSIIEKSLEVFKTGGEILQKNKTRSEKAVTVGQTILAAIVAYRAQNGGVRLLPQDLYERCNNYQVNARKAKEEMNAERSEITQIMDMIKKEFTSAENDLDNKKVGTPAFEIQQAQNDHAKAVHEEQERVRQEAERTAAKQKEAVAIKAEIETKLNDYFNSCLLTEKQRMNEAFNKITLENYDGRHSSLLAYNPVYAYAHFEAFNPNINTYGKQHTAQEIQNITLNVTAGRFELMAERYKEELLELKGNLIAMLPSKRNELEELARAEAERLENEKKQRELEEQKKKANEAERLRIDTEQKELAERQRAANEEAQRLRKQQEEREEAERQRLQDEADETRRKEQERINLDKTADETLALFEKEHAIGSASVAAPAARKDYEIAVKSPVAWALIFQFWFENEGKNKTIEQMGKTSLNQMKAFAEKAAKDKGTKIDSPHLSYEDSFTSINKKAK
jgi:hypothetical protein